MKKDNAADLTIEGEWSSEGSEDIHCHLDRAYTWAEKYYGHEGGRSAFTDAPLWLKQDLVGKIHTGLAFMDESLHERMELVVRQKIAAHEKVLWAINDCSPDIGDRSFATALGLKKKYAGQLDIRVGAYPIFGFKSLTSKEGKDRIDLIHDLAPQADFLVGLPERDARAGHEEVGFDRHMTMLIELAVKHQIPLQMHLDQTGKPGEGGTARFVEAVHWKVTSSLPASKRPRMIAVHVISPSGDDESAFVPLVKGLRENNIEVAVCPHAAISMRPMRNVAAPTHNLIARVLEMLLAGVPVHLGTDNIRDLFMPRPASPLLSRELDLLASALRFYEANVIYKLVRGEQMNNSDMASIERSLDGNYNAYGWPQGSEAFLAMNPAFQG